MRDWRQAQDDYEQVRILHATAEETWNGLGQPGPDEDFDPYDDSEVPPGWMLGWYFQPVERDRTDQALENLRQKGRPPTWRTWKVVKRLMSRLYVLGLVAGYSSATRHSHPFYVDRIYPFWKKNWNGERTLPPYVLGWPVEKWACVLRYRHWPYWPDGMPVAFGRCGRCVPWQCCDSIERDHAPSCPEGYSTPVPVDSTAA